MCILEIDMKKNFTKKVYRKLDASPFASTIAPSSPSPATPPKKIIPTRETLGLREKFKKTFLPLLIEVFELRQMVDNYKSETLNTPEKSPTEIINKLEELQENIEEIQRWSDGVIVQITKGLEEAKKTFGEKEQSPIKRLLKRIKK